MEKELPRYSPLLSVTFDDKSSYFLNSLGFCLLAAGILDSLAAGILDSLAAGILDSLAAGVLDSLAAGILESTLFFTQLECIYSKQTVVNLHRESSTVQFALQ